jgi:biopolymer transport protein ExbD
MARRARLSQGDIEVDLTAMIDVIFLLIIFFILAGRITSEMRSNEITVPPARTAEEMDRPPNWRHAVIEVFGNTTRSGVGTPRNTIKLGWLSEGNSRTVSELDDYSSYVWLREELDRLYQRVNRYDDPLGTGIQLPEVELEIRADGDAEYRLVQEVLQVASDSVDPANGMQPKNLGSPPNFALAKPFVNILFTSFRPGDRESE